MTDQNKVLYNTSEAAAALGISRVTLYRWLDAGKIEARKVNGHYYFTRAQLEAAGLDGGAGRNE